MIVAQVRTAFIMFKPQQILRLSREFTWIVLGQAAAVIGALVGIRVLTELLEPAEYGELALGLTIATLVNQLILGPMGQGATRFFAPAREVGALRAYLMAVRNMSALATGAVFLIALLVCAGLALHGRWNWLGLVIAAFCFALLSGYSGILDGIQNAARNRAIVALHQALASWGRFLIAAGLMVLIGASSTTAALGYCLAMTAVLFSQYFFFRRIALTAATGGTVVPGSVIQWKGKIFHYSWPFATWGVFTWVQQASDRWALGFFESTQEVGLYAVLFQLGYYPISLLAGFSVQLIYPIIFERAGDATDSQRVANTKHINNVLSSITFGLTIFIFIIALFTHGMIYQIFVAPEYLHTSYLLPWIVLSGGFFAVGQVLALDFMSKLKTDKLIAPKIITAIIGVFLNIIGVYLWGLDGAIAASLVFSTIYCVWMFVQTIL